MDLGRLEAFVEVATRLSFSKAADALYLTQPTVTARIQGLERELGEPLFERMGRRIRLTDAGTTFLPNAKRALHAVKEGRDAISSLRNVERGSLSIGTAPTIGTYVLPAVLEQYSNRYPNVEVSIRTGRSEEVTRMVLADEVQIGFERYLTHPEIETIPLYDDDLSLMASATHSLARARSVTVSDVVRESVIFFDIGSSYHAISQAIFRETGVAPRHTLDVDNLEMAKHLVMRGLGLAFLPRVAVEHELAERAVVPIAIKDAEPLRRRIAVIYRQRRLQSRAMMALLELLKTIYPFDYPNPSRPPQAATAATEEPPRRTGTASRT